MCTVSVIRCETAAPRSSGDSSRGESPKLLRIVCNRDEKLIRTEALPPVCRKYRDRTAILPIDPLSRGTWIGVNDAGLALCLLNATHSGVQQATSAAHARLLKSRGDIIPSLLDCENVGEAIDRAAALDPREFPPFRLIAISLTHVGVIASDRVAVRVRQCQPLRGPFMATSSSLGDELVDPVRRELFGECLRHAVDPCEAQDRFHSHQWPDRRHVSVLMARPDARTVSRTIVQIGRDHVRMTYRSLPEVQASMTATKTLTLELAASEVVP